MRCLQGVDDALKGIEIAVEIGIVTQTDDIVVHIGIVVERRIEGLGSPSVAAQFGMDNQFGVGAHLAAGLGTLRQVEGEIVHRPRYRPRGHPIPIGIALSCGPQHPHSHLVAELYVVGGCPIGHQSLKHVLGVGVEHVGEWAGSLLFHDAGVECCPGSVQVSE